MRKTITRVRFVVILLLGSLLCGESAGAQDYYSALAAPGAAAPGAAPQAYQGPAIAPPATYRSGGPAWPAPAPSPYQVPQPASLAVGGDVGAVVPAAAEPVPMNAETNVQSDWYARLDYFTWDENNGDGTHTKESGPLYTLGYSRQVGSQRFRLELFGGNMAYDGSSYDLYSNTSYPLATTTRYLGGRGEYEYLFQPSWLKGAIFLGVGNRFWLRDLRAGTDQSSAFIPGTQETWWTFYPYLGMELKGSLGSQSEWFAMGRAGPTAVTFNKPTDLNEPLWPKTGVTAQLETGIRGQTVTASIFAEVMTWRQSSIVTYIDPVVGPVDNWQPSSRMLTIGGRLGFLF